MSKEVYTPPPTVKESSPAVGSSTAPFSGGAFRPPAPISYLCAGSLLHSLWVVGSD